MPWKGPDPDGDQWPTLGHEVAAWIEENLVIPDGPRRGQPFILTDEQYHHILNCYRLKPNARPEMGSQAFRYYGSLLVRPQKALALDTLLITPAGWTTVADVSIGDTLFNQSGDPVRVIRKTPVFLDTAFRVTFSDGAEIVACGEHEWVVDRQTSSGQYVPERLTTEEILTYGTVNSGARTFRVRNAAPLQLPEIELPVPPYTLGAWLGDGDSDCGRLTGIDEGIYTRIALDGFNIRQDPKVTKRRAIHGLVQGLRVAGVFKNKHVPAMYLRASEKQRWALLQGLMDTDGYVSNGGTGACEFVTMSSALRDGIRELLYTLGIKHTCNEGIATLNGKSYGTKYRVLFTADKTMPVFHLARKFDRLKDPNQSERYRYRHIVSIESLGMTPTQCVTVDCPSHTILVGKEAIPTSQSGKRPPRRHAGMCSSVRSCSVRRLGRLRRTGWCPDAYAVDSVRREL